MAPTKKSGSTPNPDETPSTDTTPSKPVEVSPDAAEASKPVQVSPDIPRTAPDHDEDVSAALERKTQDGKGDEEVPESDFHSFATEGVEKEESNLQSVEDVASEVLAGRWGNPKVRGEVLKAAGYDVEAVEAEVARRIQAGAPSAY